MRVRTPVKNRPEIRHGRAGRHEEREMPTAKARVTEQRRLWERIWYNLFTEIS
jgi:hypothetical protein